MGFKAATSLYFGFYQTGKCDRIIDLTLKNGIAALDIGPYVSTAYAFEKSNQLFDGYSILANVHASEEGNVFFHPLTLRHRAALQDWCIP